MRTVLRSLLVSLLLVWASSAAAQMVDDVVNRSLAALGGHAALAKLKSRSAIGTISLSTPSGELTGSVEILVATPKKSRTLINVDASALGAGLVVIDQRFDGTAGYVMDSLQGNRDITGNQLDNRLRLIASRLKQFRRIDPHARHPKQAAFGGAADEAADVIIGQERRRALCAAH